MFAGVTFVVGSVGVGEPLITIIDMSVMRLMESRLVHGLGRALYSHEEHGDDHGFKDEVTHASSLPKSVSQVQEQFTESDSCLLVLRDPQTTKCLLAPAPRVEPGAF